MRKDLFKAYFSFTRKERNAVIMLLILVSLFFLLPHIIPAVPPDKSLKNDSVLLKSNRLVSAFRDSGYYTESYKAPPYKYRYPARNNYHKNYTNHYAARQYPEYPDAGKRTFHYNHPKEIPVIDINQADTAALLPLPGIGVKLAARIITFRDKLGGFYSIDQVKETYGLPDSTFQVIKEKLRLGEHQLVLININTADPEILKKHPYIRWNLANAITAYRKQHGDFTDLSDLLKIDIITQEIYQKIIPYLTTKD